MALAFLCPVPDRVDDNKWHQNDCEYNQEIEEKPSQTVLIIRREIDRVHHCLIQ